MTEEQATTLLDDMNAWLPEAWESWIVHGKGGEIYGKLAFEVPTARLRWLIDRLSTEALSNLRRATFAVLGRAERGELEEDARLEVLFGCITFLFREGRHHHRAIASLIALTDNGLAQEASEQEKSLATAAFHALNELGYMADRSFWTNVIETGGREQAPLVFSALARYGLPAFQALIARPITKCEKYIEPSLIALWPSLEQQYRPERLVSVAQTAEAHLSPAGKAWISRRLLHVKSDLIADDGAPVSLKAVFIDHRGQASDAVLSERVRRLGAEIGGEGLRVQAEEAVLEWRPEWAEDNEVSEAHLRLIRYVPTPRGVRAVIRFVGLQLEQVAPSSFLLEASLGCLKDVRDGWHDGLEDPQRKSELADILVKCCAHQEHVVDALELLADLQPGDKCFADALSEAICSGGLVASAAKSYLNNEPNWGWILSEVSFRINDRRDELGAEFCDRQLLKLDRLLTGSEMSWDPRRVDLYRELMDAVASGPAFRESWRKLMGDES